MAECPWCWDEVRDEDAVMSLKNGLLYHDECCDAFHEFVDFKTVFDSKTEGEKV